MQKVATNAVKTMTDDAIVEKLDVCKGSRGQIVFCVLPYQLVKVFKFIYTDLHMR